MANPEVSVIVPTRNRPQAVQCCLEALARQKMPGGSFEVIVVDDGGELPLALDASRWANKFPLTVIRQANTGPAGARNCGVDAARGELLAFTDDDCLPMPEWLDKLIGVLREYPEALVGGSTFNGLKDNLFAETSQIVLDMVYEHFNRDPAYAYFFASNNIACARSEYSAVGRFDKEFEAEAAEDREFCDRWRISQRPLVWQKSAIVEHRHATSAREFARMHFRYGQGAFVYQQTRKQRKSGTMAEDLGFHRSLPRLVAGRLAGRPWRKRGQIIGGLLLWQAANTAGFFQRAFLSAR